MGNTLSALARAGRWATAGLSVEAVKQFPTRQFSRLPAGTQGVDPELSRETRRKPWRDSRAPTRAKHAVSDRLPLQYPRKSMFWFSVIQSGFSTGMGWQRLPVLA